nr:arylsulfatase [Quercus suber]
MLWKPVGLSLLCGLATTCNGGTSTTKEDAKPNIVFILSDDQDLHMSSLSYMPFLEKHITNQGTSFSRHYCTVALCCPSRVSLWTGGYPKFVSQGFNEDYLPLWLQDAGYDTYYVGKLFNAQTVRNYNSPHAAGWTGSEFLLDPFTYEYQNATFQRNHASPVQYEHEYSTDVLAKKAYGFLDDALDNNKPFFLTIAPTAPHSNVHIKQETMDGNFTETSATQSPPVPADRHKHLFDEVKVPRTPHFNPDQVCSSTLVCRRKHIANVMLSLVVHPGSRACQSRIKAMSISMMDFIGTVCEHCRRWMRLSIQSRRNWRQQMCCRTPTSSTQRTTEDINVPLIVRGPGIASGATYDLVTTHTDLAPTFMRLAGAKPRDDLDGSAIPLTFTDQAEAVHSRQQEHVNVEMWGIIMSEGKYGSVLYPNHTYKALRVIGKNYNLLYTVWCNNEHELYDLNTIVTFQPTVRHSHNYADFLAPSSKSPAPQYYFSLQPHILTTTLAHLVPRLDSLLMVLKTCQVRSCTHPWETLHPAGEVRDLLDALDVKYNEFYEKQQPRIEFVKCEKGYLRESEGPSEVVAWMVDELGWDGV